MMWVYSSVVHPLGRLQEATKKIRDGNLDFALEVENDDEIGQLCQDFEEMRMRLKENAEEKIQYDKENKELISNISHDLKTPITAIKGYVEGIMDGVASSPEKLDRDVYKRQVRPGPEHSWGTRNRRDQTGFLLQRWNRDRAS